MKKILLATVALFFSCNVYAQETITDQINAVDAAQEQAESEERAAQQVQAHHAAEQRAAVIALKKQKETEALADKKRDQNYEDQLRALQVQDKALQIEAEKARVARQNDYIDQELKQKAAESDVIKSQADSNRNLSEGTKALLEKTGDAQVRKESGIFR